jgi:2-phospho-L-lactate guanylyltransferase
MVADVPQSPLAWSLVIPVKVLARAKSRLAAHAGASRSALALAMAADTVSAAVACPAVCAVVVVTDDAEASGTGALAADLPAVRPGELDRGLRAAAGWPEAFVPDAAGTGTTLYTARPGVAFRPRFGPGSAGRYRSAGAAELLLPDAPGLRRDVDTPDDLRGAAALGLGPRTAALEARLR